MKINIILLSVIALSVIYNVEGQIFDITKYGAMEGGGDASQAIVSAWKEACAAGGTVLVPKGEFFVMNLNVEGPCKGPLTFQLEGTLNAPTDVTQQLKDTEWILINRVDNFTLNGGGVLDGQGQETWTKKEAKQIDFRQPYNLHLNGITKALVQDITVQNSKMFQINVIGCTDITFKNVTIIAPDDSPNTDGIHIGRSTSVNVIDSTIMTGDDCVSIGDGSQHITVTGVRCGPGHGIAVGSLGKYKDEAPVVGVLVKNCTLTNTENGLRVKSIQDSLGPGIATDIHFEDIIVNNVTFPINVDQAYCPAKDCGASAKPSDVQITKLSFNGITGTSSSKEIVKLLCSASKPCQEVELGNIDIKYPGPEKTEPLSLVSNVTPMLIGIQNPPINV